MRILLSFTLACSLAACQKVPPPARVPSQQESSAEHVVVNYGPSRLRLFPAPASEGRYVLWASERPGLPAVFRPLGMTEQRGPTGFVPRAGELAFVDGRIVEAPLPASPTKALSELPLLVYDKDAKTATQQMIPLPGPCSMRERALIQSDGKELFVAAGCAVEDKAMLLRLDASLAVRSSRSVAGAGAAELLLHHGDADYLLIGPTVMRVPSQGEPVLGTVPQPAGDVETRELLMAGELLLLVDGSAGRVIGMDRTSLGWKLDKRFYFEGSVQRLRAAASASRLQIVVSERGEAQKTELVGLGLSLGSVGRDTSLPQRLILGSGPVQSDHELAPVSDGKSVVLLRTHGSNSGPLVAMTVLHM